LNSLNCSFWIAAFFNSLTPLISCKYAKSIKVALWHRVREKQLAHVTSYNLFLI
jgi:hypothetical protein